MSCEAAREAAADMLAAADDWEAALLADKQPRGSMACPLCDERGYIDAADAVNCAHVDYPHPPDGPPSHRRWRAFGGGSPGVVNWAARAAKRVEPRQQIMPVARDHAGLPNKLFCDMCRS